MKTTTKKTTTEKIAELLSKGRTITPIQALNQFGCMRLGARIHELRRDGLNIETINHKTPSGKYVAKYKLAQ